MKLLTSLIMGFLPGLTGLVVRPGAWYAQLDKPAWTPPNAAFGPAWLTLYACLGVALWLVRRTPPTAERRGALMAFAIQHALNAVWTPVFFGAQQIGAGLAVLMALLTAAIVCGVKFRGVRRAAGWLFVPYVLWLGYACALNAAIWRLNAVRG